MFCNKSITASLVRKKYYEIFLPRNTWQTLRTITWIVSKTFKWCANIIIFSRVASSCDSRSAKMELLSNHSWNPRSFATPTSCSVRLLAEVLLASGFSPSSLSAWLSSSFSSSQSQNPFRVNPHLQASSPNWTEILSLAFAAVKAFASFTSLGASCRQMSWRRLGGSCIITSSFNLLICIIFYPLRLGLYANAQQYEWQDAEDVDQLRVMTMRKFSQDFFVSFKGRRRTMTVCFSKTLSSVSLDPLE